MPMLDVKSNFDSLKKPSDLMRFMNDYITYGFVGKSGRKYAYGDKDWQKNWLSDCIVQSGDEMLETKLGTCWDQVELERKWFSEHKYEFKTIFSWFEIDGPNNFPTHTFLAYKKNNKWFWFEHSFTTYRGIHEYNTLDELINDVKNKQLISAINSGVAKPGDEKLIKGYIYTKPRSNLGVVDFIDHVRDL